ncbi:NAD-dependent epimerase/dehydratase family protein [Paraliobacillus sediminis]|uniref:NAD-dependent epimerase/dehydratase family protein n=1 Tax=Paraliobacillus sediminis TaxID=1885916 RepID=UPI000E3E7B43|nr:NAD-dependent epimerase/dehydratase family protein [Paraliobacillus sediminis]
MRVLVTGGAGFIGRHVISELLEKKHHVSVIDLEPVEAAVLDKQVHYYCADITTDVTSIFEQEKPDIVIHLAAQVDVSKSVVDPKLDASSNILGTINILENCNKHNVKKIIYASSAAIYGEPTYLAIDEKHPKRPNSFYGVSKLAAESYIETFAALHGLNYTILRYANVYGPGSLNILDGNVISRFIDKLTNDHSPTIFGDGEQSRDFIYVQDVAQANIAAIDHGYRQIVNISTNHPTTLNELVDKLNIILEKNLNATYLPSRIGDISYSYLSNELAREQLDWENAYSLEEGLRLMVAELKNIT